MEDNPLRGLLKTCSKQKNPNHPTIGRKIAREAKNLPIAIGPRKATKTHRLSQFMDKSSLHQSFKLLTIKKASLIA